MQVLLCRNAPIFVGLIQIQSKRKPGHIPLSFFRVDAHLSVCKWIDGEVSQTWLRSFQCPKAEYKDSLNARQRLNKCREASGADSSISMGFVHGTGPLNPQRSHAMVSALTCYRTLASLIRLFQRRIEVFQSVTADTVVDGPADPSPRKLESNANDTMLLEEDRSGISKSEMLI